MTPDEAESLVLKIPLAAFRHHLAVYDRGRMGISQEEQLKALRAGLAVEARRIANLQFSVDPSR